jgi:hypothetical protein
MVVAVAVPFWGPSAWKFLHSITFAYPPAPTPQDIRGYKEFFVSVGTVLPCPACAFHYSNYITEHKNQFDEAFRSGPALQQFMYNLHEDVNNRKRQTGDTTPRLTFEQVRQMYTKGHVSTESRPSTDAEWGSPFFHMAPESHTGSEPVSSSATIVQWMAFATAILYICQHLWQKIRGPKTKVQTLVRNAETGGSNGAAK